MTRVVIEACFCVCGELCAAKTTRNSQMLQCLDRNADDPYRSLTLTTTTVEHIVKRSVGTLLRRGSA